MTRKWYSCLIILVLCLCFIAPAAGAEPSPTASATVSVGEHWNNPYTGYYGSRSYYAAEFFVIGPNNEQWMVSTIGNKFRLRDKNQVNPTIYTTEFLYRGWQYDAGNVVSVAIIDSDGDLYNPYFNTKGINTVRYSGVYTIISNISIHVLTQ